MLTSLLLSITMSASPALIVDQTSLNAQNISTDKKFTVSETALRPRRKSITSETALRPRRKM